MSRRAATLGVESARVTPERTEEVRPPRSRDLVPPPVESDRKVEGAIRTLLRSANGSSTEVPFEVDSSQLDVQHVVGVFRTETRRYVLLEVTPVESTVNESSDFVPSLSPREFEIARMIAEGLPNKTVAAVLEISPWTVGTHLRRIFAKTGVQSRAALVTALHRHGILGERGPTPGSPSSRR